MDVGRALIVLTTESVRFRFVRVTKPAVFSGRGGDGKALRYVFMPMRFTS
ncbi:hypothetical protein KBP30_40670 [Streptomyces sp. Go40/10]|nr:hypothetical protein [Streptomyces sp. Go40/10]UFR07071.1 hypothetical protein KBP30_40670 [Streptomyces sp. Go40/10]